MYILCYFLSEDTGKLSAVNQFEELLKKDNIQFEDQKLPENIKQILNPVNITPGFENIPAKQSVFKPFEELFKTDNIHEKKLSMNFQNMLKSSVITRDIISLQA